jgi:hypothetical protein
LAYSLIDLRGESPYGHQHRGERPRRPHSEVQSNPFREEATVDIEVKRFEIKSMSTRFYANGKQQIRVDVEVLLLDRANGFVKVPLTQAQIDTISVVAFSPNLNQTAMPTNWSFTTQRNNYDMGSPGTREAEADVMAVMCGAHGDTLTASRDDNNVPDIVLRYVESSRISTERLMARMVINNVVYTTNMSNSDGNFTSSVTLEAITPLRIEVSQLTSNKENKQDQKYTSFNPDIHQTIDAYYWTLPAGIRAESITRDAITFYALAYTSGSQSGWFLTKGTAFLPGAHDTNAREGVSGGCVQSFAYRMNVASNQWAVSVLKTRGCSWTSTPWSGSVVFTIVDNYGNTHRYRVSPSGQQGSEVSISAA